MNDGVGKAFLKIPENKGANMRAALHRSFLDISCLLMLNKVEIKRNKETNKGERRNNIDKKKCVQI